MTPQQQAELLLERSINRYRGANAQIEERVEGWRGKITLNDRLNNLFLTGINSDDLTVQGGGARSGHCRPKSRKKFCHRGSPRAGGSRGRRARGPMRSGISACWKSRCRAGARAQILLGSYTTRT